ncbi:translation initiation factor 2A [Nematocida parisii]|nr:translation initiation factor 2A [Nematocida parisii]
MPKPIGQVLSFSDKGVCFDTFNEKSETIPCVCCKLGKEWVAYTTSSELIIQSTITEEKYAHSIPDIKSIECLVDCTACVITKSDKMYFIQKDKVMHTAERVKSAMHGKEFLVYSQEVEEAPEKKEPLPKTGEAVASDKKADVQTSAVDTLYVPHPAAEPPKIPESAEAAPSEQSTGKGEPTNQVVPPTSSDASSVPPAEKEAQKKTKASKAAAGKKKEPVTFRIQKKEGMRTAIVNKAKPRFLKVYSIIEKKEIENISIPAPLTFSMTGKFLVTVRVYKSSPGEIELIRLQNGERVKKQPVIDMISAVLIPDLKHREERMLCLCSLGSSNGTYYDAKVLYYIDTKQESLKLISSICNPITDTAFLKKNEFAVCYDNSPSKIGIFNSKGEKIKNLKEGVRNKMFFNRQENIVCLAGMNNLPGNMELAEYPSEAVLSINEELGCSVIDWSPEGRYYLVGITNKMSIDNKVILYDYYSQKSSEVLFKELKSCIFAGKDLPFSSLENLPDKIRIKKSEEYIPPCLRKIGQKETAEWVAPHIIKDTAKAKENRIAAIKKELEEIERIEEQMAMGQVVPGGIMKIQKKDALLKKLNRKKKSSS